jgi:hypothetical protein
MALAKMTASNFKHISDDDLNNLKLKVQKHFSSGLVTVIGSGLSAAQGISGMGALADHLVASVPKQLTKSLAPTWEAIAKELKAGQGLEAALLRHPPQQDLESIIVKETAALMRRDEAKVIRNVVSKGKTLPLTRLLRQFSKSPPIINIITPNYDRLVEVAAEDAGLGVDTMFLGTMLGRYDATASSLSFVRSLRPTKKTVRKITAPRIELHKPHGSLDWCMRNGKPTRAAAEHIDTPLIITPGLNKYLHGYNVPFDRHREKANACIDKCTRLLIIGYGFNDDHLETHLSQAIGSVQVTLIISRTLSPKALQIINACPNVIAFEHGINGTQEGTIIWQGKRKEFLSGVHLWDVDKMVTEIFGND